MHSPTQKGHVSNHWVDGRELSEGGQLMKEGKATCLENAGQGGKLSRATSEEDEGITWQDGPPGYKRTCTPTGSGTYAVCCGCLQLQTEVQLSNHLEAVDQ